MACVFVSLQYHNHQLGAAAPAQCWIQHLACLALCLPVYLALAGRCKACQPAQPWKLEAHAPALLRPHEAP